MWIIVGMIESVVGEFFCGWRAMKASQTPTNSQPISTFSIFSKNKKRSPSNITNSNLTKTSPNQITYISNHFFKFYIIKTIKL